MSRGRIKLAGGSSRMPDLVELVAAGRSVRRPPRPLVARREGATVMLVVFRAGGGFLRLGMGREGGMSRVSRHRERVIHDSIPRGCARRVPCPAPALLPWRSAGPRKYSRSPAAASGRPVSSLDESARSDWLDEGAGGDGGHDVQAPGLLTLDSNGPPVPSSCRRSFFFFFGGGDFGGRLVAKPPATDGRALPRTPRRSI